MIVIHCPALVLVLTAHGSDGELIRRRVAEAGDVYAPTLLDYEIQSALLGMQRGGTLTEKEVERAVAANRMLPIAKHETLPFWERVRKLHAGLSGGVFADLPLHGQPGLPAPGRLMSSQNGAGQESRRGLSWRGAPVDAGVGRAWSTVG